MAKSLPIVMLIILFFAASCQKADLKDMLITPDSVSTIKISVASVSGPTTTSVNQEVSYLVTWPHSRTYTAFRNFKTDTLGQTSHITLYVDSNSCQTCIVNTTTATYKFKPTAKGTYYLKFLGRDSTHTIVDTVTVK
ncbi:hypothetical protein HH214_03140 [Mucilaginibacter robiniae]|uniref:GOLD domain-containing protein n=1 Tax=Mucilaginibacter robiniae TaxID=2728022 RepID=A0A7L5DUZ0_9SPHI|nr:hypothetical protein [Mucilaginibacter robiniae]QJD94945.1 hypothetical protein HH214_03140 [Mucilaginibacter robiniae]